MRQPHSTCNERARHEGTRKPGNVLLGRPGKLAADSVASQYEGWLHQEGRDDDRQHDQPALEAPRIMADWE
jgi:hypothetical protein